MGLDTSLRSQHEGTTSPAFKVAAYLGTEAVGVIEVISSALVPGILEPRLSLIDQGAGVEFLRPAGPRSSAPEVVGNGRDRPFRQPTPDLKETMHSPPPISAVPACEIMQTWDHFLIQRAFDAMAPEDREFLWEKLNLEERHEPGEIPERHTPTGENFLWHELIAASRPADGMLFVVNDAKSGDPLFVAPERAMAQAFARRKDAQSWEAASPSAAIHAVPDRPEADLKKPPATASRSLA